MHGKCMASWALLITCLATGSSRVSATDLSQLRQILDAHKSRSQHLHTVHDISRSKQPEILHKMRPETLKFAKAKAESDPIAKVIDEDGYKGLIDLDSTNKTDGRKLLQAKSEDSVSDSVQQDLGDVRERFEKTKSNILKAEVEGIPKEIKSPDLQDPTMNISWVSVLWMTILMGGAAGLGSFPFFFVGSLSKEWAALANALACGVMLACSFDLVHEGQPYGGGSVIIGIVLGAIFISSSQQYLEKFEDVRFQGLHGINARKILLMIGIMAAHAFGEGAGVGVSFCGGRGWAQGVLVTLAIGLHNVPEGLAVSTILVARGIKPSKALLWTLFTAMPQPLVAVPSFLFVDTFRALLPVALGFAAGCMVWMVFAELLPDALADASHGKVASTATLSAAWLEGLRMLLATFEGDSGEFLIPRGITKGLLVSGLFLLATSSLAGILGGLISRVLVKSSATGLGFASGLIIWQALISLASLRNGPGKIDFLSATGVLCLGVLAAFVLKNVILPLLLNADNQEKLKEGGTPKKELNGVIVAADENGMPHLNGFRENGLSGHNHVDLEAGLGDEKRVFAPYRESAVNANKVVIYCGFIAMAALSICQGYRMKLPGKQEISLAKQWIPLGLWSLFPGMVASSLLRSLKVRGTQNWSIACFSSITMGTLFVNELNRRLGNNRGDLGSLWLVFVSGLAMACGFGILFPHARQQNWKRSIAGLTKGLVSNILLQWAFILAYKHANPLASA